MKRRFRQYSIVTLAFISGLMLSAAVLNQNMQIQSDNTWAGVSFDARILSGEPPLDVAALRDIVGDAPNDAAAATTIRAYYDEQADRLAGVFREQNEARRRALFGMYIVHLAVPYNFVETMPETLLDFVNAPTAHCGVYSLAQSQVYGGLGLTWRNIVIDGGWHGLIEAQIDGAWEVFDSTSNVWVSTSVDRMLAGDDRVYREFYTPILDRQAGAVYRAHIQNEYSVPELRAGLPLWGLRVFPSQWEVVASG